MSTKICYTFRVIGTYLANVRLVVHLLSRLSFRDLVAALRVLPGALRLEDKFGVEGLHIYIYSIQGW